MKTWPWRFPLRQAVLLLITWFGLATGGRAAEGPTLSRYVTQVTAAGPLLVNLDLAVVDELCKDEDGCEVVLSMDSVNSGNWVEETRTRLIMATHDPDHTAWSSGSAVGSDANSTLENVAVVTHSGTTTCSFNDGSGATDPTDPDAGFSLWFSSGFLFTNAVCTLVLID